MLGDKKICDKDNVNTILTKNNGLLTNKLDESYGSYNTGIYPTYLSYLYDAPILDVNYNNKQNGVCVWAGHMAELIGSQVFAILWGGGATTSIAGPKIGDEAQDLDDGGYLSGMIDSYMNKPYDLQGNVINKPY
jgi:hypothetical protein